MELKVFNTTNVFRSNMVIPQAVIAGDFIFVSGTTGINPATGKLVSDSYEQQLIQAFENIKTILEDAGSSMTKVVKTTLFMVTGMDKDFSVTNNVYSRFFPAHTPARSGPQVMPFPGNILISVECIALM